MLQLMCTGCRQPFDEDSDACGYCGLVAWTQDVELPPVHDVWCTTQQRYVPLSLVRAGQAYVCVCARVHEVLECGACGKAWGTAVNSYGDTDRLGLRRCSGCRTVPAEPEPEPATCSTCGHDPHTAVGRTRRGRRHRAGSPLECLECGHAVGRWEAARRRPEVLVEAVLLPVEPPSEAPMGVPAEVPADLPVDEPVLAPAAEWREPVTRLTGHEHDARPDADPVRDDPGAVGEPAAA